jgi:dihydroneopterin aldolase
MDTIFIRELRLDAWVGLHKHEKIAPQTIELDIEMGVPGEAVFSSGKVADTIDYSVVVEHVRALVAKEHVGLVETLADRIANMILADFGAPRVRVSIAKLGAVRSAKHVGVCVERTRA